MFYLHDWQNFYVVTGTAAATLIGLLFVAMSLGGYLTAEQASKYTKTFVGPTFFSYFQILLISCLALIPVQLMVIDSGIFILLSGFYVGFTIKLIWRLYNVHQRDEEDIQPSFWLWYIILPFLISLLLATCAVMLWSHEQDIAALLLASVVLLSLGINIRNSWTLIFWLIEHRDSFNAQRGNGQQEREQKVSKA